MNQLWTRPAFQTDVQEIPGRPDVLKLAFQGRITFREAPEFREIILREVANARVSALVVELGGVERIDTAGLAVLVESLLAAQERNKKILLCQPSQSVLQLFRMAKLHDALKASCSEMSEVEQRLKS